MKTELSELSDRTEKLHAFIEANPIFKGLSSAEQGLMTQQLAHMRAYQGVLSIRVQAADDDSGDNSPAPPHP